LASEASNRQYIYTRMKKIKLKIGASTFRGETPESWHELTFSQLVHAVRLLPSPRLFFIELDEHLPLIRQNIFQAWTAFSRETLSDIQAAYVEEFGYTDGNIVFIADVDMLTEEATNFLFTTHRKQTVIAPDLLRCPIPKLDIPTKRGLRRLYAPSCGKNGQSLGPLSSEALNKMTIYELGVSFSHYERWAAAEETAEADEAAWLLLATIYRDKKPDTALNRATNYGGDVRLPLRGYEATVGARVDLLKKNLPTTHRDVLLFWFGCCRHHFAAQHPDIFSGTSGEEDKYGYAGIILELSRQARTTKNEIADQNAHSTMIEMRYEMDRARVSEKYPRPQRGESS
jgi:hypothetical protein